MAFTVAGVLRKPKLRLCRVPVVWSQTWGVRQGTVGPLWTEGCRGESGKEEAGGKKMQKMHVGFLALHREKSKPTGAL